MRKVLLLIFLLLLAGAIWLLRKPKYEGPDYWVTFGSTCPTLVRSKGSFAPAGSWVIEAKHPLVLRTYLIDKGEKTLKSTLQIDPTEFPQIYVTPTSVEADKAELDMFANPTLVALANKKQRIWEVVEFPLPEKADCYQASGTLNYPKEGSPAELLMFFFDVTKDPKGHGKMAGSLDELERYSKEEPATYVAYTCSSK